MNNFRLIVVSDNEDLFYKTMEIAFNIYKYTVGWKVIQTKETWNAGDHCNTCFQEFQEQKTHVVLPTLIFYWTDGKYNCSTEGVKGLQSFPFKMNWKTAAKFALDWLSQVEYPKQPVHDGDNHKGWRVYNEAWGHVNNEHEAMIGIRPEWAMYGK